MNASPHVKSIVYRHIDGNRSTVGKAKLKILIVSLDLRAILIEILLSKRGTLDGWQDTSEATQIH
jgi:hypothetical protein